MTVLVGVDGSTHSRAAVRWAWAMSAGVGEPLVALGSWQYPSSAALPGGPDLAPAESMDEATGAAVRTVLADELDEAAAEVTVEVRRGPASWALLDAAQRHRSWLVVVGKRGLGPLEGRLLGSVSRRVAELSPIPVAIVPDAEPADGPGDGPVVVGVDGSESATAAVNWAARAAKVTGSSVLVVHGLSGLPAEIAPAALDRFASQAKALVDEAAERVSAAGLPVETCVDVVDPRMLLSDVATRHDASMVVVGARGTGPVAGLLVGSVVSHIAQQMDRPVVVVPAAEYT